MSFTALRIDISSVTFSSSDTSYIEFYTAARKVNKNGRWSIKVGYPTASDASVCTIFSRVRLSSSYSNGVIVYLPYQAGDEGDYTFTTNNYNGQTTSYPQQYFDNWGALFKYSGGTPTTEITSNSKIEVKSVMYITTDNIGVYNRNTGSKISDATILTNQLPSDYKIDDDRLVPSNSDDSWSSSSSSGYFPINHRAVYGYYNTYTQTRYTNSCVGSLLIESIHGQKILSLTSDPGITKVRPIQLNFAKCSSSSSARYITEGSTYSNTLTADSGFYFDYDAVSGLYPIVIEKGIVDVTPTSASSSQFSVRITNVQDVIWLKAFALPRSGTACNVYKLTQNCSFTDSTTQVYKGQPLTLTCKATAGYGFSTVYIVNGDSYSDYSDSSYITYNSARTEFTLAIDSFNARGDVKVIAKAVQLVSKTVTNTLTKCTTNNSATTTYEGLSYSATITANTDYRFSSSNVTVRMGSTTITPTFASDNKSFTISIPSVTDNITITATATLHTYSITNTLTRCSNSNSDTTIRESQSYSATVTASSGYTFRQSDVSVKMNGVTVPVTFASNMASFTISIASPITGNIVISATGTNYVSITNLLSRCDTNNTSTEQLKGTSYSATITAKTNYIFNTTDNSVVVTMGDTSVTPTFASNKKSFTINISNITGPITISAKAIWSTPAPSSWSAGWVLINTNQSAYNVVSSSIRQTAESIDLKVSKGDVTSQLLLETDQITLESGRLVITTGNFQLDANGHMTAVGATLSGGNSQGSSVDIEAADISFKYNGSEIGYISTSYGRHGNYYYNCIDMNAANLNLVASDTIFITSNNTGGVIVNGEPLYIENNFDGAEELQKAPISDFSAAGDLFYKMNGVSFEYNSNYGKYVLCCDSYEIFHFDGDVISGVDVDNVYRVPVWSPSKSW